MGVILSLGTVVFFIICIMLIIVILLQSDKSAGMGILGGSSQSAFGSSTADVITKITTVMVALFLVGSLGLSILESKRVSAGVEKLKQKNELNKGNIENMKSDPGKKDKDKDVKTSKNKSEKNKSEKNK